MIKPKSLKNDSTIGIISPSYWLDQKILEKTAGYFTKQGYKIKFGKSTSIQSGPFAGTPQQRADDIHHMFSDPYIDAILCSRGGYGANKVLPLLDYKLIKQNPKIFIGFSDITAYLTSISQNTNLVTFHGPMLSSYKKSWNEYNFKSMKNILEGNINTKINLPINHKIKILKHGKGTGPIWGGNMTLLINRLGTTDVLNTDGAILFLEDVNEYFYSFERMLIHMKSAGMFKNIKGLIMGEVKNVKDEKIKFNKSIDNIILEIFNNKNIPIISNFPCGHGKYQVTLPISVKTEINTTMKNSPIRIIESSVVKR
tara:strand:- start:357 stop:1292 length:936 start_codon:yes stop_codon:yes gene_type:complete